MAYLEYDYEIAHRERVMSRQRAVWTLRGWLRMERHPRVAIASALVFSGAMALDTAFLLKYFGFGLQPYRWVLGVIVA